MSLPVRILFGTETGNAQDAAERLRDELADASVEAEVLDMGDVDIGDLQASQVLLIVTSTYGNGDPPANAKDLFDALHDDAMPRLEGVYFSVLALGDSMHRHFCQCGIAFDERLDALGARRIAARVDCDTDYDEPFEGWMEGLVPTVRDVVSGAVVDTPKPAAAASSPSPAPAPASTTTPALAWATVVTNVNLNGAGSSKHTRHVELAIEGTSLTYAVGDRIAIRPHNDPAVVDELLTRMGLSPDAAVSVAGRSMSLRQALLEERELTTCTRELARALGERAGVAELVAAADAGAPGWRRFTAEYDAFDLLVDHGAAGFEPQHLVDALEPLGTRMYSIASSPVAHVGHVHITVDVLTYERHGRRRGGVASTFLADRCPAGTKVACTISPASHFRLAPDDVSVIMIGPGTGVAPFRGFLAERAHRGAKGRSWLFFGSRHAATDFLYGGEFRSALASGALTRLDLAFSRDQAERIYVQDRMWQAREELASWLRGGAHVYVCGDATNMAVGVEQTIGRIAAEVGLGGTEFVAELRRAGRYHLDVY